MKLIEIYFWNSLYWALYLPTSLLVHLITNQGDVLGILLIGFLLTAVLTIILCNQEGVFPEKMEPATILTEEEYQAELVKMTGKPVELVEPNPVPSPEPITEQNPDAQVKTLEVNNYAEEEKTRPDNTDSAPDGVEPGTEMRTDVDLEQLDAPDDSIPS